MFQEKYVLFERVVLLSTIKNAVFCRVVNHSEEDFSDHMDFFVGLLRSSFGDDVKDDFSDLKLLEKLYQMKDIYKHKVPLLFNLKRTKIINVTNILEKMIKFMESCFNGKTFDLREIKTEEFLEWFNETSVKEENDLIDSMREEISIVKLKRTNFLTRLIGCCKNKVEHNRR